MARASSNATMAIRVVVTVPRERYSQSTFRVEAGSVAEAIAPNTMPEERAILVLLVSMYITRLTGTATSRGARTPSKSRMENSCFPCFLKISKCSSPPTRNPMMPSAKRLRDSRPSMVSAVTMPKPTSPMSRPIMI